jgi:hypothetical protein
MAIDTAARRFSSIGPGLPWSGPIIPDGVIAASDRRALAWCYSGLAAGNSYSIEAESGAFTMTGYDAELTPTTSIDTLAERFAAMNIGSPWRGIHLIPSGEIGRNQRQVVAGYYVPYATGPTYTITCESGTFTWDGEPSFSDFEITGESGVFTMTGNDATLKATRTLYATAGVYAMTGSESDLRILTSATLIPENGLFVMTGSDAIFTRPRTITAETAAFVMTGSDATLQWFDAAGELVPLPAVHTTHPGGWNKPKKKRNYVIRGRKYLNIDDDELIQILAQEARDIAREDIRVTFKGKKPHPISKELYEGIRGKLTPEEIDEEEAFLLL